MFLLKIVFDFSFIIIVFSTSLADIVLAFRFFFFVFSLDESSEDSLFVRAPI